MPLAYAEPQGTNESSPQTITQTLRVPLNDKSRWHEIRYDKIPAHTLRFSESGLEISVRRSAMPLLFPLPRPLLVKSIHVKGHLCGNIKVAPEQQGKKGHDDYSLRVGLVEPGPRTLTLLERWTAASWVKALFEFAPAGSGIAKVHFLNLGVNGSEIGSTRQHPMSKLLEEEVVAAPRADGSFEFTRRFDPPLEVSALWISADGDDTKSSFETVINRIELETHSP